jgi:molybdate transport system ATP-binding protein
MPGNVQTSSAPSGAGVQLLVRARVMASATERPRLDVDLALTAGLTAVMGPSGAGKTTLLATIAGLVRPDAGRIKLGSVELFNSEKCTFVPAYRRRIALVFQSLALFPHLSAWENVAYGLRDVPWSARRNRALAWLARARVDHLADRDPSSLSGGEAQRVAIARALASEPRALLLDEPFSALDRKLRQELGAELQTLVEELHIPAVFVTHHQEDAVSLASHILVLEQGQVSPGASSPP